MTTRTTILATLGLVLSLPMAASAQTVPAAAQPALTAATTAYFSAMGDADYAAIARVTSPTFHIVQRDGTRASASTYLQALYAHHLDASTPRQTLKIGTAVMTGTTATETVDYSSFDYRLLDGQQWLERDYATHKLTFVQAANGSWLLDEDLIASAAHYE